MSHSFATYFTLGNLNTALVADDPAITDSLVFAAVTFPVLGRSENALVKQSVFFGLQRPVVDRFRFDDFSVTPSLHFIRSGKLDE